MSGRPAGATPPAVELIGLAKQFGDCVANRDVTLSVPRGTIHALVGENGAGKSTAMSMLYGLIRPDAGEIRIDGRRLELRSPRDAARAGIGMVHQHFMLAGPVSGLDNILLGAEPAPAAGWVRLLPPPLRPIDRRGARARLEALAAEQRFAVDLDAPVETLPVGVQQRLEILKLLFRDAGILILDEPTAVLTPQETDELFQNLRRFRDAGKTIIIITHKLREVMSLADDVTVLRRGEVVAQRKRSETSEAELAALMVGRAVRLTAEAPPPPRLGAPALAVERLTARRGRGKPALADVSLAVRGGEIVGVAGVEGNGQSELLAILSDPRAAFSARGGRRRLHATDGTLAVLGADARRDSARRVLERGVGVVPEDRLHQGLVVDFDLTRNFALGLQRLPEFSWRGLVRGAALLRRTREVIARFDIRPTDPAALAGSLSGGNQQKLVIARAFERRPRLLICAQPTRGVDVGAIEMIHAQLLAARAAGTAVLLVSSSLEEIMALSDRIVVLYEGRIAGVFARGEADEARLGAAMGGAHG
jgi:simple sugar transport system ATP-binding protein